MNRIPTFFSWPHSPFKRAFHTSLRAFRGKALRGLHALVILAMLLPDFAGFLPRAHAAESVVEVAQVKGALDSQEGYSRPVIPRQPPRLGIRPAPNPNLFLPSPAGGDGRIQRAYNPASGGDPGLPLLFVENVGQYDPGARFQVRSGWGTIYLTEGAMWITQLEPLTSTIQEKNSSLSPSIDPTPAPGSRDGGQANPSRKGANLRVQFTDANQPPTLEGIDPSETVVSYYFGNDPGQWRYDVPTWKGVRYVDLYPGVDLQITGEAGRWSWKLVIRDLARFRSSAGGVQRGGISLRVDGADGLALEGDSLSITTEIGALTLPPLAIEMEDGSPLPFSMRSSVLQDREWFFPVPDREQPASSSLPATSPQPSASSRKQGKVLAVPVPVAGTKAGHATPVSSPLGDENDLVYSTYFGGSGGDEARGIAMDSSGAIHIGGTTSSPNLPTEPGVFQDEHGGGLDAFVAKLASNGAELDFVTYVGGSLEDDGCGIALDGSGSVYITGRTMSSDFPHGTGTYQTGEAFVTKLTSTGGLGYSSLLGGSGGEQGFSIVVDGSGNAYVAGQTFSSDFPGAGSGYDSTYNGGWDGFVAKLDSGGNPVAATYLGGNGNDCEIGGNETECTVALGGGGVYIAGSTYSTDFPTTTGAYRGNLIGGQDAFVAKFDNSLSELEFSTLFGGTGDDCYRTCALAVDAAGVAYIAGSTNSSDFPASLGGSQGGWDVFLAVVPPGGGSLSSAMVLGGAGDDLGRGIALGLTGEIFLVGDTASADFPVSTDVAYQPDHAGMRDAFVITAKTGGLVYSTFLGGSHDEIAYSVAVAGTGNAAVGGWAYSNDFPTTTGAYQGSGSNDAFISVFGLGAYTEIDPELTLGGCGSKSGGNDGRECPKIGERAQGGAGDPINTYHGSFDYSVEDLSIPTSAGSLSFQRSYASLATEVYTTTLGYGWTHNHDTRLIFPGDPLGESGHVLFKAHSANLYKFIDHGDNTYTASAGVLRTLERQDGPPVTYRLTDNSQAVYVFDADGKLLSWSDPQGHAWTYSYAQVRLDRVTDDTGRRYLDFEYDAQGRLETVSVVSDQASQEVAFGYDLAGDLARASGALQQTWNYTYDEAHRLRLVTDPGNVTVVHTEYDSEGRATQQYDAQDHLILQIDYSENHTTITNALGGAIIHHYNPLNALENQSFSDGSLTGKTYDRNFNPLATLDQNGNGTQLTWSENGANLTRVVDGEGGRTDLAYDDLNNLTEIIDPRGFLTTYTYSGTLLVSSIDAYTHTTYYTYTTSVDAPQPAGLLKETRGPLGSPMQYAYNAFGQVTSITYAPDRTTIYSYDSLGRLQKVVDPDGQADWTCYDTAGRLVRVVANASGDGGTPQTDPCDAAHYQPSADPAMDRITTTIYDDSGNAIATIDPEGIVTRTYYEYNRPVVVVQNLTGQSVENSTPPVHDPDYPDQNVRTETRYDYEGRVIATIDPLVRVTRTYYDELGRPVLVVQNLTGEIEDPQPPAYDPDFPDQNIRNETIYDPAGNVIAAIDPLGRKTRTYYDRNNRPVVVVQNFVGDIENETPPAYDPDYPDRNIRTETVYDESGNAIATIDTLGRITRTYYDALDRPETVIQNLDPNWGISNPIPPDFDPDYPDQNVRMDFVYDAAGRQIAVIDPLGHITRTYYDEYDRPQYVVQNLAGQGIEVEDPPAYDPDYPDQNVRTETIYDEEDNAVATVDPLGRVTRTYYDEYDRPQYVMQNLAGQAIEVEDPPAYDPDYPDQNVRSESVYDPDGTIIATIDNAGSITRTYFDDLGRAVVVVQNLTGQGIEVEDPPAYDPDYPDQNVRTETVYDAVGQVVRTVDPNGIETYSCYDGMGRVVKTVVNPSVSDPCGNYTPAAEPDQDITTEVVYDALGNMVASIDANGFETTFTYDGLNRLLSESDPLLHTTSSTYDGPGNRITVTDARSTVTRYEYDGLDRLAAVVENDRSGVPADEETNVRTEYTYDGNGNRRTIRDANGHVTTFNYDNLGRLEQEIDALTHTTTYNYDAAGNRVSLLDANGFTTTFVYDGLNRLLCIDYPAPDADVSFTYDTAGNRQTMTDGLGTTDWEYDALSRIIAVTDPYTGTVGYAYDAAGNRTSMTYPDTKRVSYVYDDAGRLQVVTGWDALTTTYQYDRGGRPETIALPGGLTTTYTFDNAGNLLGLAHSRGAQALSSFEYAYDEVGNRTAVTETVTQPTTGAPDLIFADGFESGDLSAWTSSATDGGDLSVSAQAAIAGSYGMQAVIDDNTAIYVTDESPDAQARYRLRFYFDPNSIAMESGNAHYLLYGYQGASTVVFRLEFGAYRGDYRLRAGLLDDGTTWTNTNWVVLRDQMHYLELDWRAGAQGGGLTLWVDGEQAAELTGIDNDTRRIDKVCFGAVSGIDSGTRGTYFFDAFESRSSSYIGADPTAPEPPAPPTPPDAIFADGFESGDLSAWAENLTDGGDLSVTSEAALAGSYGMQVVVNDNTAIYVTDWSPFDETRYRVRFRFDPNSISMTHGEQHKILEASDVNKAVAVMVFLGYTNGQYWVSPVAVLDNTGGEGGGDVTLSDAPHVLEIDWQAASAPGANDGHLTFWLDGVQQWHVSGMDNDTKRVDAVSLGAQQGIDSGTRGTYYFDAFESRRESYIGTSGLLPGVQLGQAPETQSRAKLAALVPELAGRQPVDLDLQHTEVLAPRTLTTAGRLLAPLAAQFLEIHPAPQAQASSTTITYTYDSLYRLTGAAYSTGDSFVYTYDAVGNRLSETACIGVSCTPITTNYVYDHANRLTSVGGVSYTWDNNGNLLDDGVNEYTYNHADRLTAVSGSSLVVSYGYNGEGDRLQQTVDSVMTSYTLDLNAGLTQVLSDGTNTYLYGQGRIAQYHDTARELFLGDALGSVRQMVNTSGEVTLAKSYEPYGEVLSSTGDGETGYGFTGEWTDATGLVYLRARYYAPAAGRFISHDPWEGDDSRPMSYNAWLYVEDNPINLLDPTGMHPYGRKGVPPNNICYPLIGADKLACEKIVRGVFPTVKASNAELKKLDRCECFPQDCQALATKLFPWDLNRTPPKYQEGKNKGYNALPCKNCGAINAHWYHFLLETQNGTWNDSGKKHVSFAYVIRLVYSMELANWKSILNARRYEAEAFARKSWSEGFYYFMGGRQCLMERVNNGLFGNPKGGVYNPTANMGLFKKSARADVKGLNNYDKTYASYITGKSSWRRKDNNRPYEWANLVKNPPKKLKDAVGVAQCYSRTTDCFDQNSEHIGWISSKTDPAALYVLTPLQQKNLCGGGSCVP